VNPFAGLAQGIGDLRQVDVDRPQVLCGVGVLGQPSQKLEKRPSEILEGDQLDGALEPAQALHVPLVDEGVVRPAEALEDVEHPPQLDTEMLVVEAEADEEERAGCQQVAQRLQRRLVAWLGLSHRIEAVVAVGGQDETGRVVDVAVQVPDGGRPQLAAPEVLGLLGRGVDVPDL